MSDVRTILTAWNGEIFEVPAPETVEEFFQEGMVTDEAALCRLAVYGWLTVARRAYLDSGVHPDDFVYQDRGIRQSRTSPTGEWNDD